MHNKLTLNRLVVANSDHKVAVVQRTLGLKSADLGSSRGVLRSPTALPRALAACPAGGANSVRLWVVASGVKEVTDMPGTRQRLGKRLLNE